MSALSLKLFSRIGIRGPIIWSLSQKSNLSQRVSDVLSDLDNRLERAAVPEANTSGANFIKLRIYVYEHFSCISVKHRIRINKICKREKYGENSNNKEICIFTTFKNKKIK